jgi:hypothetical protein
VSEIFSIGLTLLVIGSTGKGGSADRGTNDFSRDYAHAWVRR